MGARWHKILEFVPSCPIYGWLAWWCDFFPVGPTFEDHPQVFSQKGPAPWNLFLTPAPRPLQVTFVGWWSWTYVVVAFCKDKFIFSKKNCVLDFGRALALTQNSWICPIISYLWMVGLVMRLFSCGANLWRSSAGIQPKKVQPLGIYFWHVRLGLFLVKLNICGCSLLQGQIYFQQKNLCFAFWARVDTKFLNLFHHVLSMDGWPGDATFFLWGQPLKIIRRYSAKKVQPLGIYFWHLRLGLFKSPLLAGEAEHMWL